MREIHLREIQAASLEGSIPAEIKEHLKGCLDCRNSVEDYQLLDKELVAVLRTATDNVRIPRPKWHELNDHLRTVQQRVVTTRRLSILLSLVLVANLVFIVSSFLGTAFAYTVPATAVRAPTPVSVVASSRPLVSTATPVPLSLETECVQTPVLAPHPVPFESVTLLP